MRVSTKLKMTGLLAAGAACLAATPAAANRCNNSLAVDAPTTMARVARQCNVNLAELREANPGVNPSNVRPGQHLALPDEIERYISTAISDPEPTSITDDIDDILDGGAQPRNNHPYIADYSDRPTPRREEDRGWNDDRQIGGIYQLDSYQRASDIVTHRIRIRDRRLDRQPAASTVEYRGDRRPIVRTAGNTSYAALNPAPRINIRETPLVMERPRTTARHNEADSLSYQERSKLRLAAASNGVFFAGQARTAVVSPAYAEASTTMIDCPVIKDANGVEIHQVSSVFATGGSTFVEVSMPGEGPSECTLFSVSPQQPEYISYGPGEPGVPLAHFTNRPATPGLAPRSTYSPYTVSTARTGPAPYTLDHSSAGNFSLQGDVVAVSDGCLIMRTATNDIWRLAAAPPSGDLLGKRVTVWGSSAAAGTCGAGPTMVVSHAVYAEPLEKR